MVTFSWSILHNMVSQYAQYSNLQKGWGDSKMITPQIKNIYHFLLFYEFHLEAVLKGLLLPEVLIYIQLTLIMSLKTVVTLSYGITHCSQNLRGRDRSIVHRIKLEASLAKSSRNAQHSLVMLDTGRTESKRCKRDGGVWWR